MFEKLDQCPACKHPSFSNQLIVTDHSISGEDFALVRCNQCQLLFTNPRPAQQQIGRYYDSNQYISHHHQTLNFTNLLYRLARIITLRSKEKLIKRINGSRGRLLDFGSGTGHFLKHCHQKGWDVTGVESSDVARKNNVSPITPSTSLDHIKQKFDVITAWHVIEHVHDLRPTLRLLRNKLQDNGTLLVALPNLESYDAHYYKKDWAAYDVPRHLYHFNQTSFRLLAKEIQLQVRDILPLFYDSYYVSILSEKYKHGSFLQAILTGWKSNRRAHRSGEYSSLIYVLTK